jgi:ankyrin repeat protein
MNDGKRSPSSQNLLDAIEENQIIVAQKLIESGSDVNTRDRGGSTPLSAL